MEAIIALLLVISTLTACAGKAPDALPMEDLRPSLEEDALVSEAAPGTLAFQIEIAVYEDSALSDDGTELAVCRFEYPVMTPCWKDGTPLETAQTAEEEQALAAAETFNSQFGPATVEEEFQEMTAMAREDLAFRQGAGMEWNAPYMMELGCEVYQTEHLVSVSADYYSFTGGAHPNTVLMAWNFDLTTGQFFTPEVLGADGQAFSGAVERMILDQIDSAPEEARTVGYWENYPEIVSSWSSYAVSFDEGGMTVGFSPYELAAYAAGEQIFHLPYEQLTPYLSPHGLELLGLGEETEQDGADAGQ